MRITELSVHRRTATTVIALGLWVLGLYGLSSLPVDFLPNVTYPMIKLHLWWRGATPEEIDRNIADPIERQMATVDGLDYLESSSIEGMYTLQANFKYGVDVDVAYQDALAAMARVARQLPKDIDPPVIIKADPSQLPVLQLTIASDQWDLVQLRTWADNWLQDQLLAVPGVAGTEIVGGLEREIRVHIDPQAMEKHGLTLPTVMRRLEQENIEQFAGRVTQGPREFIARTMGEFRSLEEIRNVLIARQGESKLLLRDIATVEDSHEEIRIVTRLDGEPCVKLSVLKQADANTVQVAKAVWQRIEQLQPAFPDGIRMGVVENQADYVAASLAGVRNTAIEAAILVIVVVFLFLGSWRAVMIMVIAMPTTLVLNFGLMNLAGFSLNVFSLGGLVIAIGVLLSNTIVVVENITRWRMEKPQLPLAQTIVEATREVGQPVVAATLAFLMLFLPFLLVPGLASLLFRELIMVVAGVVLLSLLVAVTVTPMVSSWLIRSRRAGSRATWFERLFDQITQGYLWVLQRALRWRWATLGIFVILLALGALLLTRLGGEFLPQMDDGRIMVKVKLPTGASVAQTDEALQRLEAAILGDPLIESAFTLTGGKVWGLYTYEIANEGEIDIQLVPRHQRDVTTKQYIAALRRRLADVKLPAGKAMVMQMKVKGIRKMGEADVEVKIKGPDVERLFALADQAASVMNGLPQFKNVYVSMDMTKPEYQIRVDRVRAAELGVSVADIATTLRTFIGGGVATQYRDAGEYYDVRLIVPETRLHDHRDIEQLQVNCAQGGYVRISDVATVAPATGPVEIVRDNQVKQVIVRGDAAGTSIGQAQAALSEALGARQWPVGYELSYGGQAQMMADMQRTILAILAFALFFAFVVLAVQFDSLKLPSLILAGAPFCLAGAIMLMWLLGLPLGATVIIGVLLVVAAIVNDGVLILTFARQLQANDNRSPADAVMEAARLRFRPIAMTTLPLLVGFLPLALNLEAGGDMLQPMAAAAIGGLAFEVFVALLLLPVLYVLTTSRTPAAVPSSVATATATPRTGDHG